MRIAESLAKMRLATFATDADVDEALRLFQVSTLDAAMSGSLAGLLCQQLSAINYIHCQCVCIYSPQRCILKAD